MPGRLSRRNCLASLSLSAAALATGCASSPTTSKSNQKQPNIVFFLIDDLGWTDLGCYGSTYYETPNLDALAKQGMLFTDAYAACAVCSPTRASVLTGRYPARIGITDWIRARFQGGAIPADPSYPTEYVGTNKQSVLCPPNPFWMKHEERTIAEQLKQVGYTTCHIGKWHLGPDDWYPETQGFDYNIGGCDYGQPPSYFDPYSNNRLKEIPTLKPRQPGEYLTDRLGDEAVHFIDSHQNKPFFLYMANYAVHTPLQGKEDYVEKYKAKPTTNQKNPVYAAMVQSVDECVGKVMKALEDRGLADNTIVIFTSDNGGLMPATDNAPLRSGKGDPYEGGIREPLLVRWPGKIAPNTRCYVPVSSIDFFPTLCEAVGVTIPQDRPIDGVSMMPLWQQTGQWDRDALYWHFPHYRYTQTGPYSIIRDGDWKLLKRYDKNTFELFNLKVDLSESNDLASVMPDKVAQLNEKLEQWLKHCQAKVPVPNPNYDPNAT
jgi:arylsulfatase A